MLSFNAQAGLIGAIAKAAKKVDVPDANVGKLIDAPDLKHINLDLPHGTTPELLSAKLNIHNEWVLHDASGAIVKHADDVPNAAVIIDKAHLPQDLNSLDSLSHKGAILIRSNKSVFQLEKGIDGTSSWSLKAGDAFISVASSNQLKTALWHLRKPWARQPVRVLGASEKLKHSTDISKGIDAHTLIDAPHQLRGQTIVMSGPIKGDVIQVAGNKFSLQDLQSKASENDISLVILESAKKVSPSALVKQLDGLFIEGQLISTADFLNKFSDGKKYMPYALSPSSKQQVLIQRQNLSLGADDVRLGDLAVEATTQLAIRGARIYRPSEERQKELDQRIFSWLPSGLFFYFVLSAAMGLWAFSDCRNFLRRFWAAREKDSFASVLTYGLFKFIRLILLIVLILPLLGYPIAIYRVVRNVWALLLGAKNIIINFMRWIVSPFTK